MSNWYNRSNFGKNTGSCLNGTPSSVESGSCVQDSTSTNIKEVKPPTLGPPSTWNSNTSKSVPSRSTAVNTIELKLNPFIVFFIVLVIVFLLFMIFFNKKKKSFFGKRK